MQTLDHLASSFNLRCLGHSTKFGGSDSHDIKKERDKTEKEIEELKYVAKERRQAEG